MINYREALAHIPCESLTYDEWIRIGMALKVAYENGADITVDDFERWSATDQKRFKPGDPTYHWDSFKGKGVTEKTFYYHARKNGFEPIDNIEENSDSDFIRYLNALFEEDEYVGYVVDAQKNDDKYTPSGTGTYGLTAGELIKYTREGGIENALGDYNPEAGGWIRINPLDGKGVSDKNVTDYRNVLIESDTMPVKEQLKLFEELKLPARAIVTSGNKSIHVVMRVDAKNRKEYDERVNFIFETLSDFGVEVDTNNKNPSRLSRLPGLKRGRSSQNLIYLNTGCEDYEAWEGHIKSLDLEITNYHDIKDDLPPLAPELIEGILRQGHKMIITAPSKAGKTQLLVELLIALAEGKEWLGFKCSKSKVLYINLEIAPESFYHRIDKCYKALGYEMENTENINILNLRGRAEPIKALADKVICKAKNATYDVIIIDPIYKIQSGDENAAGDITKFTNELDRLAYQLRASIIYSHHHSKGQQSYKEAIDRGSGSGVFARDADAILDLLELESDTENRAYRITSTLREFKDCRPFNVYFQYPKHIKDEKGSLKNAKPKGAGTPKAERVDPVEEIMDAFDLLSENGEWIYFEDLLDYLSDVNSAGTLRNRLSDCNKSSKCPYTFNRMGERIYRNEE